MVALRSIRPISLPVVRGDFVAVPMNFDRFQPPSVPLPPREVDPNEWDDEPDSHIRDGDPADYGDGSPEPAKETKPSTK